MADVILLTPQQCDATTWAMEQIHDGAALLAIRGLAGTGKTTLIPTLRDLLVAEDIPTAVGSPTHRAAMVLRKKGIPDATTLHKLALTPYFKGNYARAHDWLGEPCPCRLDEMANAEPDVGALPWLVAEALKQRGEHTRPATLRARAQRHGAKKALESIGIKVGDYLDGFGPKQGEGVLIVDEASMLGTDLLALVQQAFAQIVLIGDPGQLPPVKDTLMLHTVPGFDLTEVHRQAKDSPILQLAYAAREDTVPWRALPVSPGHVEECTEASAEDFLTAPLLVWRNETRLAYTTEIRKALGYWHDRLYAGEPLVCRATSQTDRALGFINNSQWRIAAVDAEDSRLISVYEEGEEDKAQAVRVHLEELDGEDVDPEAVLFRFGYAMTCHTAQGGEWPLVYISKPDMLAQIATCKKKGSDEHRQWAYTAITRAKTQVRFLTMPRFIIPEETATMAQMTLNSTGKLPATQTPLDAMAAATVVQAAADDITDPVVPPGTVLPAGEPQEVVPGAPSTLPTLPQGGLALLQGFAQHATRALEQWCLQYHKQTMVSVEDTLRYLREWMEGVSQHNEHAMYSLGSALAKIQEDGVKVLNPPYQAVVQVLSPAGLPITLTVAKGSSAELIDDLGRLEVWLAANGYSPGAVGVAA
jgi:exodeoxyribonuclease-5